MGLLLKADNNLPGKKKYAERAFFGRKSGKRMLKGQQILFTQLLPSLEIKLTKGQQFDPQEIFQNKQKIILEIGYGGGEHIAKKAKQYQNYGFIGCEVFSGGIGKLLKLIDREKINNIALFNDDALKLLNALKENSIDEIYLLYPDPWPKKKHHKRRFISKLTLEKMAKVLKKGAKFYFATDIEDYANWTLAHILQHKDFSLNLGPPASWHQPFSDWVETRYEQKARREKRLKSFYFTFIYKG